MRLVTKLVLDIRENEISVSESKTKKLKNYQLTEDESFNYDLS
jgi:hypothetical protein